MNKNELAAEMKRKGFTYNNMSKALHLSENSFWRKMNGHNDFTLTEIQTIAKILGLNGERIESIFLNNCVEKNKSL